MCTLMAVSSDPPPPPPPRVHMQGVISWASACTRQSFPTGRGFNHVIGQLQTIAAARLQELQDVHHDVSSSLTLSPPPPSLAVYGIM